MSIASNKGVPSETDGTDGIATRPLLFSPLQLRDVTVPNRIWMSPMCQYSCRQGDGKPHEWHYVHLGARAVGGVGMVMAEATGVSPEGRISPADTGLWNDEQMEAWRPITEFIKASRSVAAVQLAHAGRKASTAEPWTNGEAPIPPDDGGWVPLAPSAIPFNAGFTTPRAMDGADIAKVVDDFVAAALRAVSAGFEIVELHMAHGYLLHSFLSPLSNHREDEYGGTLENRMRLPLLVAQRVREALPRGVPLLVRISGTDYVDGGWDVPQSVEFCRRLGAIGVDLIDCSSGGAVPNVRYPVAPGYQVPIAATIQKEAGIPTAAVGAITDALQAEAILAGGSASAVFLGRVLLREPYWALYAARQLGYQAEQWPNQYLRGKPPPIAPPAASAASGGARQ